MSSEHEEEEFSVEYVMAARPDPEATSSAVGWQYYVKWEGYPEDQNTWEPENNFDEPKNSLKDFWELVGKERKRTEWPNKAVTIWGKRTWEDMYDGRSRAQWQDQGLRTALADPEPKTSSKGKAKGKEKEKSATPGGGLNSKQLNLNIKKNSTPVVNLDKPLSSRNPLSTPQPTSESATRRASTGTAHYLASSSSKLPMQAASTSRSSLAGIETKAKKKRDSLQNPTPRKRPRMAPSDSDSDPSLLGTPLQKGDVKPSMTEKEARERTSEKLDKQERKRRKIEAALDAAKSKTFLAGQESKSDKSQGKARARADSTSSSDVPLATSGSRQPSTSLAPLHPQAPLQPLPDAGTQSRKSSFTMANPKSGAPTSSHKSSLTAPKLNAGLKTMPFSPTGTKVASPVLPVNALALKPAPPMQNAPLPPVEPPLRVERLPTDTGPLRSHRDSRIRLLVPPDQSTTNPRNSKAPTSATTPATLNSRPRLPAIQTNLSSSASQATASPAEPITNSVTARANSGIVDFTPMQNLDDISGFGGKQSPGGMSWEPFDSLVIPTSKDALPELGTQQKSPLIGSSTSLASTSAPSTSTAQAASLLAPAAPVSSGSATTALTPARRRPGAADFGLPLAKPSTVASPLIASSLVESPVSMVSPAIPVPPPAPRFAKKYTWSGALILNSLSESEPPYCNVNLTVVGVRSQLFDAAIRQRTALCMEKQYTITAALALWTPALLKDPLVYIRLNPKEEADSGSLTGLREHLEHTEQIGYMTYSVFQERQHFFMFSSGSKTFVTGFGCSEMVISDPPQLYLVMFQTRVAARELFTEVGPPHARHSLLPSTQTESGLTLPSLSQYPRSLHRYAQPFQLALSYFNLDHQFIRLWSLGSRSFSTFTHVDRTRALNPYILNPLNHMPPIRAPDGVDESMDDPETALLVMLLRYTCKARRTTWSDINEKTNRLVFIHANAWPVEGSPRPRSSLDSDESAFEGGDPHGKNRRGTSKLKEDPWFFPKDMMPFGDSPHYDFYYRYGTGHDVARGGLRKGAHLQEVFPLGGIIHVTARALAEEPSEISTLLRSISLHPFWEAYMTPASVAMLFRMAKHDPLDSSWVVPENSKYALVQLFRLITQDQLVITSAPQLAALPSQRTSQLSLKDERRMAFQNWVEQQISFIPSVPLNDATPKGRTKDEDELLAHCEAVLVEEYESSGLSSQKKTSDAMKVDCGDAKPQTELLERNVLNGAARDLARLMSCESMHMNYRRFVLLGTKTEIAKNEEKRTNGDDWVERSSRADFVWDAPDAELVS